MLVREKVGKVFQVFVVGTFGGGGSGRWVVGGRLENGKGWKNSVMVVMMGRPAKVRPASWKFEFKERKQFPPRSIPSLTE
jgi:hypothetical protein